MIKPTEGNVKYNDEQLFLDFDILPDLGVIIESTGLLDNYTSFKNLEILSEIKKVASSMEINADLDMVGLKNKKVKTYSLGMRQKLSIAQAIFEQPKILLLDEPMNALDDESIDNIYEILKTFKENNAIIIIASHSKEDISILCDEVIVINNGKIMKEGE